VTLTQEQLVMLTVIEHLEAEAFALDMSAKRNEAHRYTDRARTDRLASDGFYSAARTLREHFGLPLA
jgi:hypothetical protein